MRSGEVERSRNRPEVESVNSLVMFVSLSVFRTQMADVPFLATLLYLVDVTQHRSRAERSCLSRTLSGSEVEIKGDDELDPIEPEESATLASVESALPEIWL